MTGKQHLVIAFSIACHSGNPVLIGGALLGSLLPDIDSYHSIISNVIPIQKFTGGLLMKHRGGVHSLLADIIVGGVAIKLFGVPFGVGVTVGYLSHILSDMTTNRGVTLLYPFYKKRIKLFGLSSEASGAFAMLLSMLSICLWMKTLGLI